MIGPFQARPYDGSQGARRLSDLALERGRVSAEGSLRQGATWGGAVSDVANIAAGTMAKLGQIEEDRPFREQRATAAKADTAKNNRRMALDDALKAAGQYDPDDAIEFLRKEGFAEEATAMQKELSVARENEIDAQGKKLKFAADSLANAGTILSSVRDAVGAEAETYAAVLPKLRELVGPDLGKALPETYDPKFVEKAMTWGMSTKDRLTLQAETVKNSNLTGKDKRERDEYFTGALSKMLGTAQSQEQWAEALTYARGMGAPVETISKFGTDFSPEAAARAAQLGGEKKTAPTAGSFGSFVEAASGGKPVDANTLLNLRRKWEDAGRKPDAPGGGNNTAKISETEYRDLRAAIESEYQQQLALEENESPSSAQRNAAIRWKSSQLDGLDKLARASGLNPLKVGKGRNMGELGDPNWHPPMKTPGAVAPPMPKPSNPGIQFRSPTEAPTSSQAPKPVTVRTPSGKVRTFASQADADGFMRDMGYTLKK